MRELQVVPKSNIQPNDSIRLMFGRFQACVAYTGNRSERVQIREVNYELSNQADLHCLRPDHLSTMIALIAV